MNWPFRSLRIVPPASPFAAPPGCDFIEPLLPLYADGMASPDEIRFVEAHLPGCAGCRESLFWMQATHRALAARPVAVPPASLQSRIAEAIAASAAPSLRPARSFTLRPAYAAAASLTVLGVALSYSLLHSPVPSVPSVSVVNPAPPMTASVPPVPLKAKNVLPQTARVKTHSAFVARNAPAATAKPDPAKSITVYSAPEKAAPANAGASPDHVADNAPARVFVPLHVSVKSGPRSQAVLPQKLMASNKVPPAEMRHQANLTTSRIKPNTEIAMLPRHDKEPIPVQVHIDPPTVTEQTATVRTASSTTEFSGLLASVKASAQAQANAPYAKNPFTVRQAYRGVTNLAHTLDNEHTGYQPAVYTP